MAAALASVKDTHSNNQNVSNNLNRDTNPKFSIEKQQ